MKLTILGSGTSQGVPVIGCRCEVCTSTDSRDKRLRTSAMIETDGGARFVIDAGPDFRCQMLRAGVSRLDAILLTHEHKDHTGGIDDVRAFNFVDYPPVIHPVDIYAAPAAAVSCARTTTMPSRRRSTAAHPTSGCTRSTSHGRSKSRASESCPCRGTTPSVSK